MDAKTDEISDLELWNTLCSKDKISNTAEINGSKFYRKFHPEQHRTLGFIYQQTHLQRLPSDIEKEKEKLLNCLKTNEPEKTNIHGTFLRIAVAAMFIITFGIYSLLNMIENDCIYKTGHGENRKIELSDGSVVYLNELSTIKFLENEPRSLKLDGEAFFEVKKDSLNPFTVETPDGVKIRALGTSFNINAYSEKSYSETTLVTGVVQIINKGNSDDTLLLKPNEQIKIYVNDHRYVLSSFDLSGQKVAWRRGKLIFFNKTLSEIAEDLQILKDVKIIFRSKKATKLRFTATFDKKDSIHTILKLLSKSKPFEYSYDRNKNEWSITE